MDKFNFDKIIEKVERMKTDLPKVIANDTLNYFMEGFDKQEWDGQKWKEVQRRTPGTPAYKYPKKGADSRRNSAILVRTGTLRRALSNSIVKADFNSIKFVVTTGGENEYAGYNNYGTSKIPKRQFVGDSPLLRKRQLDKIKSYMQKIWQG